MSSALPPEALTSNPVEHRPDKAVGVGLGAVILQRQKKTIPPAEAERDCVVSDGCAARLAPYSGCQ
ncbi:hypothetical protein, partial [Escherichia coli]|uniref:hypothetical protein n=1 Tax=Escherichia coli TaxID=562 RepID=UPI001954FB06